MDAAGLGALVTAYRVVVINGGTLGLAHVARRVYALLDVCGLASRFATFDSVEAAVADAVGRVPESLTAPAVTAWSSTVITPT